MRCAIAILQDFTKMPDPVRLDFDRTDTEETEDLGEACVPSRLTGEMTASRPIWSYVINSEMASTLAGEITR